MSRELIRVQRARLQSAADQPRMNLLSQLATLGDPRALAELRALTSHDGQAALAQALGHRAQWGDMEARTELADRGSADHCLSCDRWWSLSMDLPAGTWL